MIYKNIDRFTGKKQSNLYKGGFTASLLGKIETEMQNRKGDNGELLAVAPDTIWIPNDAVLKLKSIEAMQKVADGKATKIIIPSEMQGLVGLANGIVEGVKEQ